MGRTIKQLDEGQKRRAAEMRKLDIGWTRISQTLGIPVHSIRVAIEPGYLERHNARIATWRSKGKRDFLRQHVTPKPEIPRAVLFERERAYANYGGFAEMLGEPPFGRDALAKRQGC